VIVIIMLGLLAALNIMEGLDIDACAQIPCDV